MNSGVRIDEGVGIGMTCFHFAEEIAEELPEDSKPLRGRACVSAVWLTFVLTHEILQRVMRDSSAHIIFSVLSKWCFTGSGLTQVCMSVYSCAYLYACVRIRVKLVAPVSWRKSGAVCSLEVSQYNVLGAEILKISIYIDALSYIKVRVKERES